eukprot:TRINITY_DN200_c0_g2_i1.p1 TRINITY_DN200_c0_g2~~TRINITY_DN200_c0_g2_i1.p1  ORF type:complete len:105 (+),score=0.57 TRINITY_DN200_c0_g2_i1:42-356(+)
MYSDASHGSDVHERQTYNPPDFEPNTKSEEEQDNSTFILHIIQNLLSGWHEPFLQCRILFSWSFHPFASFHGRTAGCGRLCCVDLHLFTHCSSRLAASLFTTLY